MERTKIASRLAGFLLMCLSPLACGASEPALTLVADGMPRSVIVLADKPSPAAAQAAKILSDHLLQISGATVKVVREKELAGAKVELGRIVGARAAEAFILVGKGALAEKLGVTGKGLGAGGIAMETAGNALVLLGPDGDTPSDPWGTRYAVTTFLEDYLGVRYLWPGETGKVAPQQKTIAIPAIHAAQTPLLRQRNYRSILWNTRSQEGLDRLKVTKEEFNELARPREATQSASGGWMGWQRMGGTLGLIAGDGSILSAEAWQRFLKEHPEWFAMQADGSREPAPGETRLRLCMSNPALIEAIAQEKIKELKAHPGQISVSLTPHDGGKTGFCHCPACMALDPKEGRPIKLFWTYDHKTRKVEYMDYVSLTDRVFWFSNQIAERVAREFPDVLFCSEAYSIFAAPPVKVKLHPNIIIRFVGSISYSSDKARAQGLQDWDVWTKAASKVYYRPNFGFGRRNGLAYNYAHKLAEDFKYFAHHSMLGTDIDACMNHWATQGLVYYVAARLHWNPDLDVDALIDDYCRSGFGPAAAEIKAYFAGIEQITNRVAAEEATQTDVFTPEAVAEMRALLDAAGQKAAGAPDVLKRIAFLRVGLEWTDVQGQAYALVKKFQAKEKYDKAAAKALMDRKYGLARRILKEDFNAVNVAFCLWGEGNTFVSLGGPAPAAKPKAAPKAVEADEAGRPIVPKGK